MKRLLLTTLFTLFATAALAQTVSNPTRAEWTPSADHATVTRYELGWFTSGTDPVQVADAGKPTPVANVCTYLLPSYPIGTTYTAKVKAYAGTISSDWSLASNPFYRTPAVVTGLVVK